MSKLPAPSASESCGALHRATMAVYADLGALIEALKEAPSLQATLLALDSIAEHSSPEQGDPALIAKLKHAVGHLLESLNTVQDVKKLHPRVGTTFWRGRGIDRTWGSISSGSYHDVAIGAAEAMLEPDAAGAASSGRQATPGGGSGVIRRKVIEAALDADSWRRLAENLDHEYQSACLIPTDTPTPAAKPTEDLELAPTEGRDAKDALVRYDLSCDAMHTLRLEPIKAVPIDQWPRLMQPRGDDVAVGRAWKKYERYLLQIAAENEHLAMQARSWWTWWEKAQVEPTKVGPAPLVSPKIAMALRMAAARRGAEAQTATPPADFGASTNPSKTPNEKTSGRKLGPRSPKMGKIDRALVQLLFQDFAGKWSMGILEMSSSELAVKISGVGPKLLTGSLRPKRTPYFRKFREFFRKNRKGIPLDLINGLPDRDLRDALHQYSHEQREEPLR